MAFLLVWLLFQSERDRVLYDFKEGRSLILVATDVASRGLDVKDIHMVVNFDFPQEMEVSEYIRYYISYELDYTSPTYDLCRIYVFKIYSVVVGFLPSVTGT